MRINRASDDAAGLAISASLDCDTRVFTQGTRNINDGQGVLAIADATLSELSNIVTRIRELAQQAANATFSDRQREALDQEAQALSKEFTRLKQSADFNGLGIFDGSLSSLKIFAGYGPSAAVEATLGGSMGNGLFGQGTLHNAEVRYTGAVELADVNNDGTTDLLTSGYNGGTSTGYLTVRVGNGDGTYRASTSYINGEVSANALSVTDLNGDGLLDMAAVGGSWGGSVATFMGNGDGTFRGAQLAFRDDVNYSMTMEIAFGDFNGDRIADMVTAGRFGGEGCVGIHLGNGDGSFRTVASYGAQDVFRVAVGDLNGDRILDVVSAEYGGGSNFTRIWRGRGDGTFSAQSSAAGGTAGLVLSDLNGDDALDIVSCFSDFTAVQLGNGNGTFSATKSYANPHFMVSGLSTGDINGDGSVDIVTSGGFFGISAFGTASLLNRGDGTFDNALTSAADQTGDSPTDLALGDLNGDGVLDAVMGGEFGGAGKAVVQLGSTRSGVAPILTFSLRTTLEARHAMGQLDRKLDQLSQQKGVIGAFQSRLHSALANLAASREEYAGAGSRILDVDIASEAGSYAKERILQQAATAVLAQANQVPALAITLLRD